MLVYAESTVAMDKLNNRLWSPIFVPLLLIGIYFIDKCILMLEKKKGMLNKVIIYGFVCALVIVLFSPLKYTLSSMKAIHTSKRGIEYSYYTKSEIYKYAKEYEFSENAIVFTNNPTEIEFNLKLDARYTPIKNGIELYGADKFMSSVEGSDSCYIIWFGDAESKGLLYSIEDIRQIYELSLIKQSIDGVMYKIVK